jgi:hypothetical protein
MRPVTQYLKPETKEDLEEAAAILPAAPEENKDDTFAKPKIETSADTEKQNGAVQETGVEKQNGGLQGAEMGKQNGGPAATCTVEEEKRCGCCIPARKCLICRIFLMINWRLLLDCNFITIAIGRHFFLVR